jgi:hypothetical protein
MPRVTMFVGGAPKTVVAEIINVKNILIGAVNLPSPARCGKRKGWHPSPIPAMLGQCQL